MIMAQAFASLLFTTDFQAGEEERNPLKAVLWLCATGPAILFSLRNPRRTFTALLLKDPFVLGLGLLAAVSASWSLIPAMSLRRSIQLLTFIYFGAYLAGRYSWREFVPVARWSLRFTLGLSCVLSLLAPEVGVHTGFHEGSWRGLFPHKNYFGRYGGLCVSLALASRFSGLAGSRRYFWTDLALGLVVLIMADSRTGIAVTTLVATCVISYEVWLRASRGLRLVLASASIIMGLALFGGLAIVLATLRTSALDGILTGRVSLWRVVIHFALERPWTGYGYSAFFYDQSIGRLLLLSESWEIGHAHNATLHLGVEMGVGAILLYLLTLGLLARKVLRLQGRSRHLPLAVLAINVITGLAETACYPRAELTGLLLIYFAFTDPSSNSPQLPERNSPPSHRGNTPWPTPDTPDEEPPISADC